MSRIAPGDISVFELDGLQIAVCVVEEEYYAFSAVCTHEDVSLVDGYLEGCEVECPLHGSRFDVRNGKCMNPPATKDLSVFPVRQDGAKLIVGIEV